MSTALVVGLGHMGRFHYRALTEHLGYHVFSVDPDPSRGADYATLAEACFRRSYDVACIAVPAEHLVECAFQLAGTTMVVEKPFATNTRDVAMLNAYLQSKGAQVGVNFTERFNPRLRELRERLGEEGRGVLAARFTRWSTKPSWDIKLDLMIHDVDLARYLQLPLERVTYDTRENAPKNVRRIEIDTIDGEMVWANLLDHGQHPLTMMWHWFMVNGRDVARPADALRAHRALEHVAIDQEVPA